MPPAAVRPLGRRVPPDFDHVAKFPLSALPTADQPVGVPVVGGFNWYTDFDSPQKDSSGRYWVGKGPNLGTIRGGHCICFKSRQPDSIPWWEFYDQGNEGACVGFGVSRMMTLLNRWRYEARWLWDRAKERDGFPDTNPGDSNGTSVRTALEILVSDGNVPWKPEYAGVTWQARAQHTPKAKAGISVFRWTDDVNEVLRVLDVPLAKKLGAVPFLNSWGKWYPHITWMPGETLQRLINESGECGLVTDR